MPVFLISPKKSKKLFFAAAAAVTALSVFCVAVTVCVLCRAPETATSAGGVCYSLRVEDGDYAAFFSQIGLKTDGEPIMEKTVRIPDTFDGIYAAYNELQKHAGLDLTPYRTLQARQLTFALQGGRARCAVLLVKGARVIGGHLTNEEYGSELLPLL